jgi:hypothetical protein
MDIMNPIIIIPNIKNNSVYVLHYELNTWIIKLPYNFQKGSMAVVPNKLEKNTRMLNDGKVLRIIRYILDYDNPVPDNFTKFMTVVKTDKRYIIK